MSEEDHFPDERVLSGIIFINRNGLRWRVAPVEYGPPKTLYNRWGRCGRLGVFARMLTEMAAAGQNTETVMTEYRDRDDRRDPVQGPPHCLQSAG